LKVAVAPGTGEGEGGPPLPHSPAMVFTSALAVAILRMQWL